MLTMCAQLSIYWREITRRAQRVALFKLKDDEIFRT